MNNVFALNRGNGRYRAATEWVSRLDRDLTVDEESELKAWLSENPENGETFLAVAEQWDRFNDLSRLADLFPEQDLPGAGDPSVSRGRRHAAVAAAMIAAIGMAVFLGWGQWKADEVATLAELPTVYDTAIGEQSSILLPDGSQVTLNTNSRLEVHYSDHHRVLTLVRGEIIVDVESNPSRPLTVFVGDQMVQAVGTSFGIEIGQAEEIEVVVTEGTVFVSSRPPRSGGSVAVEAPVLPPSTLTVTRGEEVRLSSDRATEVKTVSDEELGARLAWRDGDLVFRGEPLADAMSEIGRYTTVEFVFLSSELRNERIVGRFKAGDVDGLLAVLRENLNITYQKTSDGRVLLGNL